MAKRPAEEEDDALKVRKRRYNPPKKADDDEDAGPPGKKKGKPQEKEEEDDEDGEGSLSTGYIALDIALDFRDDCIDWSKAHLLYAIIIGVVSFLIFSAIASFAVYSILRYLNHPSLETVAKAYDLGLFPETKFLADYALRYISRGNPEARAPFVFFQGAALCAFAEQVVPADQRDYYLAAANYLNESSRYNFFPSRLAEGWFLLGKSLFHSGELEQCRQPFLFALEEKYPYTKRIHWYLAHSYFLGASPSLQLAREHLQQFQNEPTALEEEIAESHLLETLIVLHLEEIENAEEVFAKVPHFRQFDIMRNFVEGQIEFFKARRERQQAINFETDPNPSLLRRRSNESTTPQNPVVAPAPVTPEVLPVPAVTPEEENLPEEPPTAPIPVPPMDEETIQGLMVPNNNFPAPVLGTFDGTSEIQRRMAEMRTLYAQNMDDDEVIVLPRQNVRQAPVPPPPSQIPQEDTVDPLGGDPILRLAGEFREAAAGHYQKAIAFFSEVVQQADYYDSWSRASRFLIGMSYMEMGDMSRADDSFRRLIDAFPSSQEAIAAGFLLGEQNRLRGDSNAALRFFSYAFETLRRTPNYASLWLPREMIMERCTEMIRSDIEQQRYANAIKLLDVLGGVMAADEIARLRGETYESWATLLQSQADTTFGERGDQLAKDAESKWRSAGAAFAVLAQLRSDRQEFPDLLWRAAENYRFGKDSRRAVIEYRKFIGANLTARRPEIHLRLGEMYLHLNILDEAVYMLEEALRDYSTHHLVPQIRLVLSHVRAEQKEWEKAKALLQLNLIGNISPSSEPYRDSMYALGKISYTQRDFDSAIPYLEDALKVHPHAIQAAEANYLLARSYLAQAEKHLSDLQENPPESVRRSIEAMVQTNRLRALFYLDQTETILADRQRTLGLTEAEKLMLRNAQFTTCSIWMDMEQYDQAAPRLNTVATMYQDRPEALEALVKLAFCLRMLGKETEAKTTLRRAEVVLNQLERIGTMDNGMDWRSAIQGQMRGEQPAFPPPGAG